MDDTAIKIGPHRINFANWSIDEIKALLGELQGAEKTVHRHYLRMYTNYDPRPECPGPDNYSESEKGS
jgi:hypothetical protein